MEGMLDNVEWRTGMTEFGARTGSRSCMAESNILIEIEMLLGALETPD